MVKIKICGITNLEDAFAAVKSGASALGFVFYRKSPRYISPLNAARIIRKLPPRVLKVGVFVDASEKTARDIARACQLDLLQLHGSETPQECAKLKAFKIIKAFRIKGRLALDEILKYRTYGYLFDTFIKSKPGGTGKSFNWALLKGLKRTKAKIFLSGGLTAKNVAGAVKAIKPDWVDVSSSVEIGPGRKDHNKVKNFVKIVKGVL